MKDYQVKNILVPIDFSTISRHAFHHAERIAELAHARITLLHVIEPYTDTVGADAGVITTATKLVREMQIRGTKELQRMARTTMKRTNVQVRTVATVGRIAPTIRRKAAETQCDLIIMGTHGASGFVKNLVGSNTYRIATLSRIPVLSVHKPIGRNGYSHIVYPVRAKARAMDKFSHALTIAKMFKAQVHVVGLVQPGTRTTEKNMRTLCTLIKNRFANNGIVAG